jgi:hypothetical protein
LGFAIKSDKNLVRTLLLMLEPAAQRVSLLNYPMPVDPFWEASVASMASSALPGLDGPRVAKDFFAFQDGESIDMKILVDHDLVEVFVGEKVWSARLVRIWVAKTAGRCGLDAGAEITVILRFQRRFRKVQEM